MLDSRVGETFKKRDRQGGQKVLIPTTDAPRNVGGGGGSCWMAG